MKANMPALPVNQMCLFASMDNVPPETRDIKNIKMNSFPGRSIFFSSVKIIQNVIRTSATESNRMESVCKYLKIVNYLQVSAYVNAVYRRFCDRISLSQFSIFQSCQKNVSSLGLEENVCSKNGKRFYQRMSQNVESNPFVLKVNVPNDFSEFI